MDQFMRNRPLVVAAIALLIFISSGILVVTSLAAATSYADIDHANWVTWLLVVPSFLVFGVAGGIGLHRHHKG